ncbi:radial spoke head protein 6 homolog A [Diorhabda carinulata]|uniref:radial spoke head protein 6 homolog A n=1 Tax=Diorhabda carinulata TaxID=1163345 RepID=UPI0025A0E008|nr:radial spoke head protein 6 homolog A [Diorhabda carinulata]
MINEYEVQDAEEQIVIPQIPQYESEFINAKMFLQMASTNTGDNLYDHLSETLNKILAERPQNIIDFFEEYSRKVKERRFKPLTDHLEDIYCSPGSLQVAQKTMPLLKPLPPTEPSTVDPADLQLADMSRNNMIELLHYLEQCGLGIPRTEMFFVMLSMRQLIYAEPISSIRFWGKIFGTLKDYFIVECELKDEEYIKRNEIYAQEAEIDKPQVINADETVILEENRIRKALDEIAKQQQLGGEGGKYPRPLPPLPKIIYEEPPEPPSELSGIGLNKMVYYVCNGVGEPWIQLPDVTPKQIRTARHIYKSFTGNLEEPICTYPEFPGKEKDYLRAQIARISAGTQISPLGYYTFGIGGEGEGGEEDEEPEEVAGDMKTSYRVNPKYEPPPLKDLLDMSLSFWVHHAQYILPQGRTTWWNPNPMPEVADEELGEELGEEEEEVEDKVKMQRVEPETGPPLLIPIAEDASLEAVPAWSVRCSSNIIDDFALAVVRSNLWPGAFCFSTQGKLFYNIYFGYGLKYMESNFSPLPLPPVEQEYPIGPEIMEVLDPTGAEEEKWRIDHLPVPKIDLPVVEEGEPEELEEEEEEEDED